MLTAPDLQAAVAAGVITADQARHLETFSRSRFRLDNGLDDLLIALGIALFGAALSLIGPFVAAPGFWLAGEFAARRTTLPIPAIVACLGFVASLAGTAVFAVELLGSEPISLQMGATGTALVAAVTAVIGAFAFQHRFRVPFAAFAIVGSGTAALVFAVEIFAGRWAAIAGTAIILACGLLAFALAVRSDRRNAGERSAVAFWLHLAAAPMIAHSVLHLAVIPSGDEALMLHPAYAGAVVVLGLFFAGTAVLLDRPVILATGCVTLLVALGHGMSRLDFADALATQATVLVLVSGAAWLGFRWRATRRTVLRLLGGLSVSRRPPPFEA